MPCLVTELINTQYRSRASSTLHLLLQEPMQMKHILAHISIIQASFAQKQAVWMFLGFFAQKPYVHKILMPLPESASESERSQARYC